MDLSAVDGMYVNGQEGLVAYLNKKKVWAQTAPAGLAEDFIYPALSIAGGDTTTYTDGVTGFTWEVHKFLNNPLDTPLIAYRTVVCYAFAIGGGGGGGTGRSTWGWNGGAGGAGGSYLNAGHALYPGLQYIRVGAGGAGAPRGVVGYPGGDTLFDGLILKGGGGGGSRDNPSGGPGGCGGGNAANYGGVGGATIQTPPGIGYVGTNSFNGGGISGSGGAGLTLNLDGTPRQYGNGYGAAADTGSGGGPAFGGANGASGIVVVKYRIA